MILLLFIPVKKCDTRGVNWGKLEDILAEIEHVINMSRNKTTGICCSILENSRMVDGVKYSPRCRYLHSQSSEFKVITSLQSVIESRNCRGKQNHKLKSKLKNFKKRKKYSKLQISESPLRLGMFKTYKKFQILKLPLWFKVSGEYIEFSRLKKGDSFSKNLIDD